MDIVLERVLSLIPRKADGKFVHGALKEFANNIGLKSGNVINDWINGRNKSYFSYLYQISIKYNVPVEWLKGETDNPQPVKQKESPPHGGEPVGPNKRALLDLVETMSDEEMGALLEIVRATLKMRETRGKYE